MGWSWNGRIDERRREVRRGAMYYHSHTISIIIINSKVRTGKRRRAEK